MYNNKRGRTNTHAMHMYNGISCSGRGGGGDDDGMAS